MSSPRSLLKSRRCLHPTKTHLSDPSLGVAQGGRSPRWVSVLGQGSEDQRELDAETKSRNLSTTSHLTVMTQRADVVSVQTVLLLCIVGHSRRGRPIQYMWSRSIFQGTQVFLLSACYVLHLAKSFRLVSSQLADWLLAEESVTSLQSHDF